MVDHKIAWHCPATEDRMAVTVEAASLQGPRADNQDAILMVRPGGCATLLKKGALEETFAPAWADISHHLRVAVLDGMGGHAEGGLASARAATLLLDFPPCETMGATRDMVFQVHQALMAELGGPARAGTTLVLADLDLRSGQICTVSVGDSRSYLQSEAGVFQLSFDARPAEYLFRDGLLDEQTYRQSIGEGPTSRLAQALGFGSVGCLRPHDDKLDPRLRIDLPDDCLDPKKIAHADCTQLSISSGDILALVSDGVLVGGFQKNPELLWGSGCINSSFEKMSELLRDNATALVVRF